MKGAGWEVPFSIGRPTHMRAFRNAVLRPADAPKCGAAPWTAHLLRALAVFSILAAAACSDRSRPRQNAGDPDRKRHWSFAELGGRQGVFLLDYVAEDLWENAPYDTEDHTDGDYEAFSCDQSQPGLIGVVSIRFTSAGLAASGRLIVGDKSLELRPVTKERWYSGRSVDFEIPAEPSFFDLLRSGDKVTFEMRNARTIIQVIDPLTDIDKKPPEPLDKSYVTQSPLQKFEDACRVPHQ